MKCASGRGDSKGKDPEAGAGLKCSKDSKKTTMRRCGEQGDRGG
jgi:hypothetical protein